MSYKPTPITAKILKTTKGGITQPILNMGAPVKMKMTSPSVAKQTSGKLKPGEGVLRSTPNSTAGDFKPAGEQKDFIPYAFRKDKKIGGGSHSGVKGKMGSDTRKAEYDKKGWAYDETISKASVKKATEKANPKPKAKVANTTKAKGVVSKDVTTANIGREAGSTEALKSKPVEKKAPKLASTKVSAPKKEVKLTRAQKTRKRGEEALASGDTKKALRLRKKFDRQKARETRRAVKNS